MFITAVCIVAVVIVLAVHRIGAKYDHSPQDRTATTKEEKRTAKNSWFADPERGWIRVERGPEAENEADTTRNSAKNSSAKASGSLWEH